MKKKIGVPMFGKRAVSGTDEQPSSLLQAKRTSRSKLLLAWSIVVLPLVWGLYATGQTVAPLISPLNLSPGWINYEVLKSQTIHSANSTWYKEFQRTLQDDFRMDAITLPCCMRRIGVAGLFGADLSNRLNAMGAVSHLLHLQGSLNQQSSFRP